MAKKRAAMGVGVGEVAESAVPAVIIGTPDTGAPIEPVFDPQPEVARVSMGVVQKVQLSANGMVGPPTIAFLDRPTGVGTPAQVGPVIPSSPAMPPPAATKGQPLTRPPRDGEKVLIDGKIEGTAYAAGNKPVQAGVRKVDLYAVKSPAHGAGVQWAYYPLGRLHEVFGQ